MEWEEYRRVGGRVGNKLRCEGTGPVGGLLGFVEGVTKLPVGEGRKRVIADLGWGAPSAQATRRVRNRPSKVAAPVEQLAGQHRVEHVLHLKPGLGEESEVELRMVE